VWVCLHINIDLLAARHNADHELLEFHRVVAVEKVEVHAVWQLLHGDTLLVRLVL